MIGILAEFMSAFLGKGMEGSSLPMALPAVLVAFVSASPEILTALRAARADRMQTAMVALTLFTALISLHDGETNVLEGTIHFRYS